MHLLNQKIYIGFVDNIKTYIIGVYYMHEYLPFNISIDELY